MTVNETAGVATFSLRDGGYIPSLHLPVDVQAVRGTGTLRIMPAGYGDCVCLVYKEGRLSLIVGNDTEGYQETSLEPFNGQFGPPE